MISRSVRGGPPRRPRRRPIRHLAFPTREHAHLRPPPRPLRVLAARRRVQDRQARRPRRGVRPARARAHRPRRDERLGRAVQGLPKHGIKPILGLEAYFVDDRTVREGKIERNHLTLLAADDEGFRNLTKLSSAGFLEGLHRGKPGVDMELLARHGKGVIALSGCLASRVQPPDRRGPARGGPRPPRRPGAGLRRPRTSTSRSSATASPSRSRSTRRSSTFAREMGRPLVATADVHYLRREDYHHHAALLCVQTKSTLAAAEDVLRHQRVLPQELGGDGGSRSPTCRRRSPRRWRSPSAATCRSSSAAS